MNDTKTTPKPKTDAQTLIGRYETEFKKWEDVLKWYHSGRFAKNYRQYTAYTDTKGTTTKISDPVAPEMVEKVIQKMFENQPRFYCLARGKNLPNEITDLISSVASYIWTNPKMIQSTGPMKQKLKLLGREFLITGNVCVETYFNTDSDNPDIRVIPIEDVIFDPSKGLKRSPVYYIRQYVTLDYLEKMQEIAESGKVVAGRFKTAAVAEIKRRYVNADGEEIKTQTSNTDETTIIRSGSGQQAPTRDQILLISRYEGTKVCRIVDWADILEEQDDVLGIGSDPLDQAIDMEVPKEPYGFSFLDFINGLTTAKDLILNQIVDYGSKALNPPLFVDPTIGAVSKATLANAYKPGGVVFANIQQAQHQPMPQMPTVGFDLMNYIQQRSESVSSIGSYLGGTPNQVSDKTRGTAAGIQTLTAQAQSPVRDRQVNIEESIVEPVINKALKITGELMGDNEVKYIFISGQNQKWVRITKGLMTGKIMLADLLTAELIDDAGAQEITQIMQTKGQDPNKEIMFDVEWIVRVETNSMAEADAQAEMDKIMQWAQFRQVNGIPTDFKKLSETLAQHADIKNPEQYDLQTPPNGQPDQTGQNNATGQPTVTPQKVSESLSYKDAPPDVQRQIEKQAGLQPSKMATTPVNPRAMVPVPTTNPSSPVPQLYNGVNGG